MYRMKFVLMAVSLIISGCWFLIGLSSRANPISTNGASIYYTGATIDGEVVPYYGGAFNGMMMQQ